MLRLEHDADPEDIPPWKSPEEYIQERDEAKKQKKKAFSAAYLPRYCSEKERGELIKIYYG